MIIHDFAYNWLIFLAFILVRYFLIAGGTFWWFYLGSRSFNQRSRIRNCHWRLIRQDIFLSVSSAALFALIAALLASAYQSGSTQLYTSIDQYGWWYLGVSFCLILITQDAYFYVIHRVLHHPFFYKRMHKGHHRSRIPTPWTSFAFEPSEALIHAAFFVGLVFIIPLHFLTLIAALLTMTVWAIVTHLGFELIPEDSAWSWLGRGLIGPVHHGIHHRHYQVNFGLYFTFWDRVFGTENLPKKIPNSGEKRQKAL